MPIELNFGTRLVYIEKSMFPGTMGILINGEQNYYYTNDNALVLR